jgi:hypothetical protein
LWRSHRFYRATMSASTQSSLFSFQPSILSAPTVSSLNLTLPRESGYSANPTNSYRIEMEKTYASPIMCPGDKWSALSTFDYRDTLSALGGVYAFFRSRYRIVVMPHGSKMQTLGANLFHCVNEASLVFAMPKEYNPYEYSRGCGEVWSIPFGSTEALLRTLRGARPLSHSSPPE